MHLIFIKSDLIVLRKIATESVKYKFGLTDTDLTLCFSENLDKNTKRKIDDYFIPASFRIGDNSLKRSLDATFVKFIFTKKSKHINYQNLCYGNESEIENLPYEIKEKLDLLEIYQHKKV